MLLSILIPAYMEEQTIEEVLRRVLDVDTESSGFDKEVIVCDDGSSDRTSEIVERIAADEPRVRLVQHADNRGKGAAIRTALEVATGEYVLIQDADLEYDPVDYPRMLEAAAGGADIVYGSRFLETERPAGMKTANYLANRILAITANLLYGLGITDEATCFKLFRTEVLRSMDLECVGFEFCPEVTAKIGIAGLDVVEVPIHYQARSIEEGKKVRWTDGFEAMWVLVKHRLKRR